MFNYILVHINCIVSAWNEWGPLNAEGISTRFRTIVTTPLNNGDPCPPLEQTKAGMTFHNKYELKQV